MASESISFSIVPTVKAFPRFFVPTAAGAHRVTLGADEAHHLTRVLRLHPGDGVGVFDGAGGEWIGYVQTVTPKVTIEIVEAGQPAAEPPVRVTLAVSLLKGAQMDAVVRDATMLGVFAIVPMVSRHVAVARRAWQGGAATERWQRVALASARQCRRAVVPIISPIRTFDDVVEDTVAEVTLVGVEPQLLASSEGASAGPRPDTALVLVGPEGGWSSAEVDLAVERGARLMHLGPRTLRAETVPTVMLSALWTQWGW
jgi:16S rRNA (uracil1498-N3)-methyltransferase